MKHFIDEHHFAIFVAAAVLGFIIMELVAWFRGRAVLEPAPEPEQKEIYARKERFRKVYLFLLDSVGMAFLFASLVGFVMYGYFDWFLNILGIGR